MRAKMDTPRSTTQCAQKIKWDWVLAILIVPIAALSAHFAFNGMPTITRGAISAKPYIWPTGCLPARYEVGDPISRACTVASVAIVQPEMHGLLYNALPRGKQWFRVGNDALYASCGFGKGDCIVYFNVRNKFITKLR